MDMLVHITGNCLPSASVDDLHINPQAIRTDAGGDADDAAVNSEQIGEACVIWIIKINISNQ